MSLLIRPATSEDLDIWFNMRRTFWPSATDEEHLVEMKADLANPERECLLAFKDEELVGFTELALRSVVDGCDSSPVAYFEGWYVSPDFREQGVGKALLLESENWGRAQGCQEMGSDSELDNHHSIKLHKHLGFEEVDRVVQFRKSL